MSELFIKELAIDWAEVPPDSYLRGIPALQLRTPLALRSPVTFLVGENGTGKSTLLEALAVCCGLNPEGGSQNYRFSSYDSHSELGQALRLKRGTARSSSSPAIRRCCWRCRGRSFSPLTRACSTPAITPRPKATALHRCSSTGGNGF